MTPNQCCQKFNDNINKLCLRPASSGGQSGSPSSSGSGDAGSGGSGSAPLVCCNRSPLNPITDPQIQELFECVPKGNGAVPSPIDNFKDIDNGNRYDMCLKDACDQQNHHGESGSPACSNGGSCCVVSKEIYIHGVGDKTISRWECVRPADIDTELPENKHPSVAAVCGRKCAKQYQNQTGPDAGCYDPAKPACCDSSQNGVFECTTLGGAPDFAGNGNTAPYCLVTATPTATPAAEECLSCEHDPQVEEVASDYTGAGKEPETIVSVNLWSKRLEEIYSAEYQQLLRYQQDLYQFSKNFHRGRDDRGVSIRLRSPRGRYVQGVLEKNSVLALLQERRARGSYRLSRSEFGPDGGDYFLLPNYGMNPHHELPDADSKNCFLKVGVTSYQHCGPLLYPHCEGIWYDQFSTQEHRQQARLAFCVPKTWLAQHPDTYGDPEVQLRYYYEGNAQLNDLTKAVGMMDFAVAMTPFLGTADLIFNQSQLTKIYEGDLEATASLCGSAAGDFFVAAKALKFLRGASKSTEILELSSYASGCASVGFTGGYLWSKSKTQDLQAADYGRAALAGIALIGLITDRSAAEILKKYVTTKRFRSAPCCNKTLCTKEPPPTPSNCLTGYCKANLGELRRNIRSDTRRMFWYKYSWKEGIPSNMKMRQDIEALAESPEYLIRRDNSPNSPVNSQGQAKAHIDSDGYMVPASTDGRKRLQDGTLQDVILPYDHIRSPSTYGSYSALISFSDSRRLPNGVEAFGSAKIIINIRKLLQDKIAGKACLQHVYVFTPQQLRAIMSHEVEREIDNFIRMRVIKFEKPGQSRENLVREMLKELDVIGERMIANGGTRLSDEGTWSRVWQLLKDYGMVNNQGGRSANTRRLKERILQPYTDAYGNAETQVLGIVPPEYITVQ